MKSRIPKTESNNKTTICFDLKEKPHKKDKTVIISSYSKKKITKSDADCAKTVMDRHSNVDDTDVFGRNRLPTDAPMTIIKHLINTQPNTLMTNTDKIKLTLVPYKTKTQTMLRNYANMLVRENIIRPIFDIKKYPLIDMKRLFKENITARDKRMSTPTTQFDDDEKYILRQIGKGIFDLPFDQMFVKLSDNRYIFLDIKKDKDIFEIHEETYLTEDNIWMMYSRITMRLTFPESKATKCSIKIIDGMSYEQLLSNFTNKMGWTNEQKKLWSEAFDVPLNWKDISIITLPNEKDDIAPMLLAHTEAEKNAFRKIYGDKNIKITRGYRETEKELLKLYVALCLPEIIQILSTIAIARTEQRRPNSIEMTPDGKCKQTFGKIIITTEKTIEW